MCAHPLTQTIRTTLQISTPPVAPALLMTLVPRQDNARCHAPSSVQGQPEECDKKLKVSTWPPNSPDPCLIELHGKCQPMSGIRQCCHHEGLFVPPPTTTTRTLDCSHDQYHLLHLSLALMLRLIVIQYSTPSKRRLFAAGCANIPNGHPRQYGCI